MVVIHLIYLPGYQNRFSSLSSWAYNFFTYDRHVRLVSYAEPSPGEIANRTGELLTVEAAMKYEPEGAEEQRQLA